MCLLTLELHIIHFCLPNMVASPTRFQKEMMPLLQFGHICHPF